MNCHQILRIWVIALLGMLVGCSQPAPYTLERIDYTGKQQSATILIGDPKIFSRETLINDRRAEVEFLKELLDETVIDADKLKETAPDFRSKFQPQILSEIRSIEALGTSLGISFDKGQSAAAQRQAEIQDLQAELAIKKLETDIAHQEKILEGVLAAEVPKTTITTPGSASVDSTSSGLSTKVDTELKGVLAQLKAHRDSLKTLSEQAAPGLRKTAASANPIDQLNDIQAYRSRLRSDLNSARLDDRHDDFGNSLMRFQFDATVFPSQNADNRWGAARISVIEPAMDELQLQELYFSWVGHAASRLNIRSRTPITFEGRKLYSVDFDATYYSQLVATGFFEVIPFFFRRNHLINSFETDDCGSIEKLRENQCIAIYIPVPINLRNEIEEFFADNRKPLSFMAKKTLLIVLQGAAHGIRVNELPAGVGARAFIADFVRLVEKAEAQFSNKTCDKAGYWAACFKVDDSICNSNKVHRDPSHFFACLVTGQKQSVGHKPRVVTYEVGPAELVERRSSVASAANSFETAIALAAALPTSGSNINAGLGYLRNVSGKVDALERLPLVIGFADEAEMKLITQPFPETAKPDDKFGAAQFGWLFGPRMEVDEENNTIKLVHRPARYDVIADVSVPSWWPFVNFHVETAWIGNWDDGQSIFASCTPKSDGTEQCANHGRFIRLPLPTKMEAFNQLTEFILRARGRILPNQPKIEHIYPSTISACAKDVRLIVEGSNLWRNPQMYLGGIELAQPRVLPNMHGVTASVNIDKFFALSVASNNEKEGITKVELTIATGDGVTSEDIVIQGARTSATSCVSPYPGAAATSDFPATNPN